MIVKFLISIIVCSTLLVACKKEREYHVYDDEKDVDKAEYQRLKAQHDNKKINKAQKAFVSRLKSNQTEVFNIKMEKKALEIKWTKTGSTTEELSSIIYFELLDNKNLRIYMDNEKRGHLGLAIEKISFDYSINDNKKLIDQILKSYQEEITDIDLEKLKGKTVNFKLSPYDFNFGGQKVTVGTNEYIMNFSFPLFALEYTKKYFESTKDLAASTELSAANKNVTYTGQIKYIKAKKINPSLYQPCQFNVNEGLNSPDYNSRYFFFWNLAC